MKTDIFQSCGHGWVFQICWHIECSTFTASSFRIWNSSIGMLSPPLAFFIVMLSRAYLTSHSRMSGSRWVITPSWLSGSWRSFLYSSFVYSCHFLISSASVRSIPFLSFIEPIFAWNVPLVSLIFLKRSLVFPILLFSSVIMPRTFLWVTQRIPDSVNKEEIFLDRGREMPHFHTHKMYEWIIRVWGSLSLLSDPRHKESFFLNLCCPCQHLR